MLLEFIQLLTEGARIDHPEDLIFSEGAAGARRAIQALNEVASKPQKISIKFDGFPALVFGRNHDGQLVVADKHMFTKKDGSGRVTSVEEFIQYDINRGANRGDLYEKIKILWPAMEYAVPSNERGYYWGDLLWTGRLPVVNGNYMFTPNTVTYSVPANSTLGKRISSSTCGIVVHQYFPDFDQEPVVLAGVGGLKTNGQLAVLTPTMPDRVTIKNPVGLLGQANRMVNQYGAAIDAMLDPVSLTQLRIKDLGALMQKYINARVRGVTQTFTEWLPSNVSSAKLSTLLGQDGYLVQHSAGVNAIFAISAMISDIKQNLIQQLDVQQHSIHASINGIPGGEGYVFSTSQGLIKLVPRASFSAANFAKNP